MSGRNERATWWAVAAIGGALTGAGLGVLGVHGPAPDLTTLGAGMTPVIGAVGTAQAFRWR